MYASDEWDQWKASADAALELEADAREARDYDLLANMPRDPEWKWPACQVINNHLLLSAATKKRFILDCMMVDAIPSTYLEEGREMIAKRRTAEINKNNWYNEDDDKTLEKKLAEKKNIAVDYNKHWPFAFETVAPSIRTADLSPLREPTAYWPFVGNGELDPRYAGTGWSPGVTFEGRSTGPTASVGDMLGVPTQTNLVQAEQGDIDHMMSFESHDVGYPAFGQGGDGQASR